MRVVFIGTGEIGLPTLKFLRESREHELVGVVTQPDKPVGRRQKIEPPAIKAALTSNSILVLQPPRIKQEATIAEIRTLEPDVIVVMAYGQILPRAVLEIPKLACLNLHASLLPRHRGAAPIQAAILAGETETGITVMYMDEGLDTGDILLQTPLPIAPDETGGSLHDRLGEIAPFALDEALKKLAEGDAPRVAQDNSEATYAPKLDRENGEVDWTQPAELIEQMIRAFNPWPGAHAIMRDSSGRKRKLKIFRASVVAQSDGQEDNQLVFDARGGALQLHEVQLEGGKRMSAAELLRGHPGLRPG